MSDAPSRLPNLYQLLGLAPLESDRGKIVAAIKRLHDPERGSAAAGSEERQRLLKIAALAQKYLLDPKHKLAYDQQWKAVYGAAARAAGSAAASSAAAGVKTGAADAAVDGAADRAASSMVWDYRRLDALLPEGDPQAPFDMASFLRSGGESRDPLAAQADLDKLLALLAGAAGDSGDALAPARAVSTSDDDSSQGHSLGLPPSTRSGQAAVASGGLARRMHKRKQRALVIGGIALASGLGGLVLLGVYLFGPDAPVETRLAQSGQAKPPSVRGGGLLDPAPASAARGVAPDRQLGSTAPQSGSGLPKPGEGAMDLQVDPSASIAEPNSQSMPNPTPQPSSPATAAPPSAGPAAEPAAEPTTAESAEPKPESKPAQEPEPGPESIMTAGEPAAAAPAADVELSSEEKRAWQQGMTEAKELIGRHDFAAAESRLSELSAAAKTGRQRGQLERLGQVLVWMKDIRQAMVDAVAELEPADTFRAGTSTIASFVEGDADRIVVRVAGRNRAYSLSELPVNLGLGLVDLQMDVQHALSQARKGAYILTHPKGDAALERGKRMLQEAAAAGAISPEQAKFYEDDYRLPDEGN